MTIIRTKPAGWGATDKFTSAQANAIDAVLPTALDKTSAGDTLSGRVQLSGAGAIIASIVVGADAATTYAVSTCDEVMVTSAVTLSRTYTLSATGAQAGDVMMVWCDATFAQPSVVTVVDQASTTLITIGNGAMAEATWAEFIYEGGWRMHRSARRLGFSQQFFASGTWTCPAYVTSVRLYGCGGGGGGGGGAGSSGTAGAPGYGGSGGGAAVPSSVTMPVIAGTTYSVTVGSAGNAGAAGTSGAAGGVGTQGGATSFGSLVSFLGAAGGVGGILGASGVAAAGIGGSPYSYLPATANAMFAGQGGASSASTGLAAAGYAQPLGNAGGAGGTTTYGGGGGGGSIGAGGAGASFSVAAVAGTSGSGGGGGAGAGPTSGVGTAGAAGGAGFLRLEWSR
jgi:hypothetical protein